MAGPNIGNAHARSGPDMLARYPTIEAFQKSAFNRGELIDYLLSCIHKKRRNLSYDDKFVSCTRYLKTVYNYFKCADMHEDIAFAFLVRHADEWAFCIDFDDHFDVRNVVDRIL